MRTSRSTWIAPSPSTTAAPAFERVHRVADSVVLGHDEYVSVDCAGRMQLPPELLQRLRISGRARVHLADDHIEIWPDKEN